MCLGVTVENAFFAVTSTVDGYKIADGKLILKKGAEEVAVFKASKP